MLIKHFCKSVLTIIMVVAISIIGLRIYTYNNTSTAATLVDRLNPLVRTETLYTKTTKEYEYQYPDSISKIENFAYVQACYTNNAEKRKIEFISFGKQLVSGKFLKLSVKGQYVFSWEETDIQAVPEKVRQLL